MTAAHRSFSAKPSVEREPITFDIDGEEFTCPAYIPGGVMLELGRVNSGGTKEEAVIALADLFGSVVVEEDAERFAKLIRSPRGPSLETLGELARWLVEAITVRPTNTSSGSRGGSRTSGRGTKAARPSKASTSARSRSTGRSTPSTRSRSSK